MIDALIDWLESSTKNLLSSIPAAVVLALAFLPGCGAQNQLRDPPKPDYGTKALTDTLTLNGYHWFLLLPPTRAYAADRSYFVGGPLASAPMEGGEFHGAYYVTSVNQMDSGAPLSKWRKIGFFQSKQECEDHKTEQMRKASDPAWLTAQARKTRNRVVDPSRIQDMVEAERCVDIAELSGK